MSQINVTGMGAVSCAGWGVDALMAAIDSDASPEISDMIVPIEGGDGIVLPVARVPKIPDRSLLPRNPRLRRASALGKYAAAALLEALGPDRLAAIQSGELSAGVVCSTMNGCVNYSNRFFGEVLSDPATASPILFPETVYNAPSSHLSALTHSTAPNDTLVGDGAEIFTALELATEWLDRGDCDLCIVVTPEEADWLSTTALNYYNQSMTPSEGAAVLILEKDATGPRLLNIPDPISYAGQADRVQSMSNLWAELNATDDGRTLWSDSRVGVTRFDAPENSIEWNGPRLSVKKNLGEALGAAAGFQLIAALVRLNRGDLDHAVITAVGGNEGLGGALFGK